MPMLRDKRVEEDPWQSGPARDGENALVLQTDKESAAGTHGLILEPDADLDAIAPFLQGLKRIEIRFPAHNDGRGFSLARRLRGHYEFNGELVARGPLIADQYAAAVQCGFDAIRVDDEVYRRQPMQSWRKALNDFEHSYQRHHSGGARGHVSILDARHGKWRANSGDTYAGLSALDALERAILGDFVGRIALISSFGVDSAVLLHLVSRINPAMPVFFIDTGKHFPETLAYRDNLIARFGFTNLSILAAEPEEIGVADPHGMLWTNNHDACCELRKIRPLQPVIDQYRVHITGRKRYQTPWRTNMPVLERGDRQIRLNPLAAWTPKDVTRYIRAHDLPPHPLLAKGYRSIGCMPCTTPTTIGEDARSGRWRRSEKTECGIHFVKGPAEGSN